MNSALAIQTYTDRIRRCGNDARDEGFHRVAREQAVMSREHSQQHGVERDRG